VNLSFGDKMKICKITKFSGMNSPSATPTFHYGGQAGEFIRYKQNKGINMSKKSIQTILILLIGSINLFADDASDIKQVVLSNLKYTQNENLDKAIKTMHSKSPANLATKQMLEKLFPIYDLKYELVKYNYIAKDSDYAYVRILQKTTKLDGPAFRNNEIDALQVFKKENGSWKLWSQSNLGIKFLK